MSTESLDCPECGHRVEVPSSETAEEDELFIRCPNPRCEHMLQLDRICYWSATVYNE